MDRFILIIILLIFGFAACENDNYPVPMPQNFAYSYQTTRGVKVKSVDALTPDTLEIVDSGITEQLLRINNVYPHWSRLRGYTEYKVIFVNSMTLNDSGCAALIVQGVRAAGTVYGVRNDGHELTIVLPSQAVNNWSCTEYLKNSVWYESEHLREWANDRSVFYYYATGVNDQHPHFP